MTTSPLSLEKEGELFSMLLRLQPIEPGQVSPSAGPQIQAAFLDLVRQGDPVLSTRLHMPNQRRPYTLSLLQGFNHFTPAQLAEVTSKQQMVEVLPRQVYWLRVTMLEAAIFTSFVQCLILKARRLTTSIGRARFEISRLLATPEEQQVTRSWIASSSFAELHQPGPALTHYQFEFASPTAFSKGQRAWGKQLALFPEPADVFESLARDWEHFAPPSLRLAQQRLTPRDIGSWCEEHVIVVKYNLETRYLPSTKFGQTGFQGGITYEVKGDPLAPPAQWLTSLAGLTLFSGVGYKTAMGMGQARCLTVTPPVRKSDTHTEEVTV